MACTCAESVRPYGLILDLRGAVSRLISSTPSGFRAFFAGESGFGALIRSGGDATLLVLGRSIGHTRDINF